MEESQLLPPIDHSKRERGEVVAVNPTTAFATLTGPERYEWGIHLRQEATRLIALADRLNPEQKQPSQEEQLSVLGTRLERAMATVRQQNAIVQQLKLVAQERDTKMINLQKEKDLAMKPLQDACSQKDATIASLTGELGSMRSIVEGLTRQLEGIKQILGDIPDESDTQTVAEFNRMFAVGAPSIPSSNGTPAPNGQSQPPVNRSTAVVTSVRLL
jgi:hypothetical protein